MPDVKSTPEGRYRAVHERRDERTGCSVVCIYGPGAGYEIRIADDRDLILVLDALEDAYREGEAAALGVRA